MARPDSHVEAQAGAVQESKAPRRQPSLLRDCDKQGQVSFVNSFEEVVLFLRSYHPELCSYLWDPQLPQPHFYVSFPLRQTRTTINRQSLGRDLVRTLHMSLWILEAFRQNLGLASPRGGPSGAEARAAPAVLAHLAETRGRAGGILSVCVR